MMSFEAKAAPKTNIRTTIGPRVEMFRPAMTFEDTYRLHATAILVLLTRRTLDPELALELTAETFAQAYRRRRQFRGNGDDQMRAWLTKIAINLHLRWVRRGRVEQRAIDRLGIVTPQFSEADTAEIDHLLSISELRGEVRSRFAELPSSQQEAVRLRIIDGLDYSEVAERLGVSEQAARTRVSRGLTALRHAMEKSSGENLE